MDQNPPRLSPEPKPESPVKTVRRSKNPLIARVQKEAEASEAMVRILARALSALIERHYPEREVSISQDELEFASNLGYAMEHDRLLLVLDDPRGGRQLLPALGNPRGDFG